MERLVVGISGSSGPHYGVALLRALRELGGIETHLVVSKGARMVLASETDLNAKALSGLADVVHEPQNLAASISSGSFRTMGMAIAPCSMKTLAGVALGYADNLLTRAAEVTLKERRKLVLVPRETPLSLTHLRNMVTATEAGAVILPPVPAFYHRPRTIDDVIAQTVGKILDQFGIQHELFERWGE